MSKAVLIMDMPKSCSKCKFMYEFQGIKKCHLFNLLYNGASRISQNNFTTKRHDECPLRPLPEKGTEEEIADSGMSDDMKQGCTEFMKGWNACLDAIMDD